MFGLKTVHSNGVWFITGTFVCFFFEKSDLNEEKADFAHEQCERQNVVTQVLQIKIRCVIRDIELEICVKKKKTVF